MVCAFINDSVRLLNVNFQVGIIRAESKKPTCMGQKKPRRETKYVNFIHFNVSTVDIRYIEIGGLKYLRKT